MALDRRDIADFGIEQRRVGDQGEDARRAGHVGGEARRGRPPSRGAPSDSRRRRPARAFRPRKPVSRAAASVTAPEDLRSARGSAAACRRRRRAGRSSSATSAAPRGFIRKLQRGVAGVHRDLAGEAKIDVVLRHEHGRGPRDRPRDRCRAATQLEAGPRRRRRIAALGEIGGARPCRARSPRRCAAVRLSFQSGAVSRVEPPASSTSTAPCIWPQAQTAAIARRRVRRPRRARRESRPRRQSTSRAAAAPPSRTGGTIWSCSRAAMCRIAPSPVHQRGADAAGADIDGKRQIAGHGGRSCAALTA